MVWSAVFLFVIVRTVGFTLTPTHLRFLLGGKALEEKKTALAAQLFALPLFFGHNCSPFVSSKEMAVCDACMYGFWPSPPELTCISESTLSRVQCRSFVCFVPVCSDGTILQTIVIGALAER